MWLVTPHLKQIPPTLPPQKQANIKSSSIKTKAKIFVKDIYDIVK